MSAQRDALTLALPDALVEAVAARAAELVAERLEAKPEPYIALEQAAAYLACPRSRIYSLVSAERIPVHRDGSRLLFRASELDTWLENGGGRRP